MTTKIYTSLPGIRARRRSLGIQAAPLAAEIGVSRAAWSQWEAGTTMPSAGYLPALAELLQCSIEDLYKDAGETDGETDCHTSAAALVRNDGAEGSHADDTD